MPLIDAIYECARLEGADAETLYAAALSVVGQWLDTYAITNDPRHFQCALVCARIAHERYGRVAEERRNRRLGNRLADVHHSIEGTLIDITAGGG